MKEFITKRKLIEILSINGEIQLHELKRKLIEILSINGEIQLHELNTGINPHNVRSVGIVYRHQEIIPPLQYNGEEYTQSSGGGVYFVKHKIGYPTCMTYRHFFSSCEELLAYLKKYIFTSQYSYSMKFDDIFEELESHSTVIG